MSLSKKESYCNSNFSLWFIIIIIITLWILILLFIALSLYFCSIYLVVQTALPKLLYWPTQTYFFHTNFTYYLAFCFTILFHNCPSLFESLSISLYLFFFFLLFFLFCQLPPLIQYHYISHMNWSKKICLWNPKFVDFINHLIHVYLSKYTRN